ncbi:cysteine proteinase [Xylaria telfairii]|nr:cysteine proteinase [Xylaria telfairii]
MAASLSSRGADVPSFLRDRKTKAIHAFRKTKDSHAYSSPLFLRRLLQSQLPELPYDTHSNCRSHTMLLLPDQIYEANDRSFLSILCADCRHHFYLETYKAWARGVNSPEHPNHMLIPSPVDYDDYEYAQGTTAFVCAVQDCFYMVKVTVKPPKLTPAQISMLQDDNRILRNLQLAQADDPQRYSDMTPLWATGSTVPTLAKYIEDRLSKPHGDILKIKKRNKKFNVSFGKDFDDLLRSLGFQERSDEEDEECWYITAPEPLPAGLSTPVDSLRAHLQDVLEELRTLLPASNTTPAWEALTDALPGSLPTNEEALPVGNNISEDDLVLLGCRKQFSPLWFSWAAILLASLCPSRRDLFLEAGLRCISERSEEASLSIIMYKSQFDQVLSVDTQVQSAFAFFGASPEDGKDTDYILNKYRTMVDAEKSEAFKSEASRHLEIISNHLGADLLGDVARGDSLAARPPSVNSSNRRMSIGSACRLLKIDADYPADLIRELAAVAEKEAGREKVLEAIEILSDLKSQQNKQADAQTLKEVAYFLRATTNIAVGQFDNSARPWPSPTTESVTAFTTPPGLKNIGNTCYLNSLLQYFYNVKPIRDMVLSYDQIQLGLDEISVKNRLTGGNGTRVTLEEAIVARQFIEELRRLFSELQTTTGAAACPSQKLANTALSSAKDILTSQSQDQPPPLPARPSPAPPVSPSNDPDTVNVTMEPTNEHHITRSDSSQTLVNEIEDTDATYVKEQKNILSRPSTSNARESSVEDRALLDTVEHVEDITTGEPPSPLTLEQKFAQISQRLEKSDRSGTSQQDVEEIIGNILEHLMRAIRPDGPMEGKPNLQADKITKLFFTTIVNSTIKTTVENDKSTTASSIDEDVLNEEVVPERWITAFPHPDQKHRLKHNLYEALDRYFAYELLSDGSLARYTTIRALPPIVHICIQRSNASGVKNKNPVIIPEELYLDRYMEVAAGSDLWNTRRRVWAIKERVQGLEPGGSISVENIFKTPGLHPSDTYPTTHPHGDQDLKSRGVIDLESELWRDIRPRIKRGPVPTQLGQTIEPRPSKRMSLPREAETKSSETSNFSDILWKAGQCMDIENSDELNELRREAANAFDSIEQHKYCLHAMICHGGGMNAGHYWVWVRDFRNQVWYKYNDSVVTKDSRHTQQVIDELNNSGDPYYVAYVQDELKDDLVEVPQRAQREEDDASMIDDSGKIEVIDSIAIDTPPQPVNSPVNAPVPEAVMEDVPPLELQVDGT